MVSKPTAIDFGYTRIVKTYWRRGARRPNIECCWPRIVEAISEGSQSVNAAASMANLIYRLISPCRILGSGFPCASFEAALDGRVDAIVCAGVSITADPFHLGTGNGYFTLEEIRADLLKLISAANRIGCPLIIGNAGSSQGNWNIAAALSVFEELFEHLGVSTATIATIGCEFPMKRAIAEFHRGGLLPADRGIFLNEAALRQSTVVAQMGIHPIVSALEGGAQYIIAGLADGAALFAADMIRRGIKPGLAYHVGQVLKCGAIACEPASSADCLTAEIYDDQSAFFIAPNPERRCTIQSIAAHSLFEEGHPQMQIHAEGILNTDATEFRVRGSRTVGIHGSRLVRTSTGRRVKLEGVRRVGSRKVSLLYIDSSDIDLIPADLIVYGRNGVQLLPRSDPAGELGVIIETTAATSENALLLADLLRRHLHELEHPGRRGTAGNLAHPWSPPAVCFRRSDGSFGTLIPSGTADRAFFKLLRRVEAAVVERIKVERPHALAYASHSIRMLDFNCPAVLVTTVDVDPDILRARHSVDIARVTSVAQVKSSSLFNLDAADAYEWSVSHLLENGQASREDLFSITYYETRGRNRISKGRQRTVYSEIAESESADRMDPVTMSLIDEVEPQGFFLGHRPLTDMVAVIRTTNVGIGRLAFDLIFNSGENYESALVSNAFCRSNIAKALGLAPERVIGTYFADACNAIKITIDRPLVVGGARERDVYGHQQQGILEKLIIPIYSQALTAPSLS